MPDTTPSPERKRDDASPFVLAVDDDPDICRLIQLHLELEGFAVETASSGDEALRIAKRARPDAIVLDALLPSKGGLYVLEELKRDPATQHIPVVYISARADAAEVKEALDLGATRFMHKPFDLAELARQLSAVVGRKPR